MRIADRIRCLELKTPSGMLRPLTVEEIWSTDDLTLCRYAIQTAERAIAEDPGCDVFGADTRKQFGVATDEEVLAVLRDWLAEMETPHASA